VKKQQQAVATVLAGGVHIPVDDVAAEYKAGGDFWEEFPTSWQDMPEARPRSRCRLRDGRLPADPGARLVVVTRDGSVFADAAAVEVEAYDREVYPDVVAEGEARWADDAGVAG
jgi:hypothetical protein